MKLMKKYVFLLLTALTLLSVACSTDDVSVTPSNLEIQLTPTWDATRGMTSSSQTARVSVTLNTQSVHWMVSSDSDWCVVDEEQNHVGNGEFTVVVTANDDFETRNAVITLAAGAFISRMEVDQSGNIFILDRIYSVVASNDTQTFDVKVKTLSEWQPADSEWIHSEVVSTTQPDAQGMTESVLRIHCDANTTASGRYGTLKIEPTDGVGYGTQYAIYQFGTDKTFDAEGKLGLPAHSGDAFEVIAPAEVSATVECPEWVTYTVTPTENATTATYTFAVMDNPSDTKSKREGEIRFSILDIAEKTLLPGVKQEFYPAGGIVSGAGFKMFAEAVNAGESISDWTSEGAEKTVQILGDVDMTDIEWVAAGTSEHPFDGIIVGNDHKIMNWSSSQPLFGHLEAGSEIRNLTIDSSSKVSAKSASKDGYTAAFAGVCNGTIKNCLNEAMVSLDVTATINGSAGVAGLVGLVGATGRVEGCTNKALITLGSKLVGDQLSIGGVAAETAAGAILTGCVNEGAILSGGATPKDTKAGLYTGGVVGYADGTIENCSTEGGKSISLKIKAAYYSYTGGIAGWANSTVTNCTNKQPLSIMASRLGDACRYTYAGGIVGMAKDNVIGCKNRGDLVAPSICKFVIMGGIAGRTDGAISEMVNAAKVTVTGNPEGADGALAEAFSGPRYAYIGGIAGQVVTAGSVVGNKDTSNTGAVSIEQMENHSETIVATGGVAGMLLGKISDAVNAGEVTVTAYPGEDVPLWKARSLGGIAGQLGEIGVATPSKGASISGSTNSALVKQTRRPTSKNYSSLPVYQGGIAGYIIADGCTVSQSSNSGEINNDSYNNNVEYGTDPAAPRANCTGGIVGAAVCVDVANTISECTNTGLFTAYRGMLSGVIAYVDGALVKGCTNTANTGPIGTNRNGRSGGIVANALNTQIEDCLNRGTVLADYAGDAAKNAGPKVGGIVGNLQAGSTVRNCKHYGLVNLPSYNTASYLTLTAGGIAGASAAGTEISNCGFGGKIGGGKNATVPFDMTSVNVCGDTNFTASTANYLWDGK